MKLIDPATGQAVWDSNDPYAGPVPPAPEGRQWVRVDEPGDTNAPRRTAPGILDIGSGVQERLGFLNQTFNPVEGIGGAMRAGERLFSQDADYLQRIEALGSMMSGVAGIAAPIAAARAIGVPAASAMMEGLLGGSPTTQAAGDMARQFGVDESGALPGAGRGQDLPTPRNEAEAMARDILQLRAEGRADEVTEQMMAAADDQYMYFNTPLPMDTASRMARAEAMGKTADAYHATSNDFSYFIPSEFRGASFFGPTPEGAQRGASASANEGLGSGSNSTIPVKIDTSRVEGIGSYSRADQNAFRSKLEDRIYSEEEVDALMASDEAPLRGNWSYFFDDLTDYEALRKFRDENPDAPIPEGIIAYRPKKQLSYGPSLSSVNARDISGRQFAHYSEGMSERPISEYVQSQGNTGFSMLDESGLALGITDPTTVRSRFARFDPAFANLRNLSAGVGGAAVLTALGDDAEAGTPETQIIGLVNQAGIAGAAEALGVSRRDIEEAMSIVLPPSQWDQLVVGPQ